MKLSHGFHLCYSTNIHRGESWAETCRALDQHVLAVRQRIAPDVPFAVGLRLSDRASRELADPPTLAEFQRWLDRHQCYVFTINGFPFGQFHGTRVKEQVYVPDWTSQERLDYTNRLFDLLSALVPEGVEGSVSTVPCSFKEFIRTGEQEQALRNNLWRCVEHIASTCERSGKKLHLGLEPEPLCYLETSGETVRFFEQMRSDRPKDSRLLEFLGVNYDTCHLAVEFEEPGEAIRAFRERGIKISKLHLSSALKVRPTAEVCQALRAFADDIYFHQVVARGPDGTMTRYRDLDDALAARPTLPPGADKQSAAPGEEWRIHFHIPLHCRPNALFDTTADHLEGVLDLLDTSLCSHLEMETYTWEVLPPELKQRSVVDQLAGEYEWCLAQLAERGVRPAR